LAPYRVQIVILATALLVSLASVTMRPSSMQFPQFQLVFGLWAAVGMSLLSKFWFRATFDTVIEFSIVVCIYFLVAVNTFSVARIRSVCVVLMLCALTMSVLGIIAYHTGYMEDKLILQRLGEGFKTDKRLRALGMLNDPNDLSQFLVVGIGMLGVFWKKGRAVGNILFMAPAAAAMVYAIYLTGSRGAILGLATLVFVAISTRLGQMQSIVLAGVMTIVMIGVNFGGGRQITVHEERVQLWGNGIAMLKTHPLFGVGYAKFQDHADLTAHNSFVLCFAELGLFGYFFWLGMIVVSVLCLQRLAKAPVNTPEQAAAARLVHPLRAALYGFLVTGWFLSRTYNPTLFILVGLVGSLMQIYKQVDPKLEPLLPHWIRTTIAWQFASVILIYITIRLRAF
jgi:O-antigen ligase